MFINVKDFRARLQKFGFARINKEFRNTIWKQIIGLMSESSGVYMKKIIGLVIFGSFSIFSINSQAALCSAECAFLDLENHGLTQSLPGNPIIKSTDFKALNDSCRVMVAGYANSHGLMKNVTIDQVPSVNSLIRSSWATHEVIEKFKNEGVKIAAILRGKIGSVYGGSIGSGDLIGFPTEAEACK